MAQKDTTVIQLKVQKSWVDRLNNLAMARKMQEEVPVMTQLDWWKTEDGRAWLLELNSGKFEGFSPSEVSSMTRKRYLDYTGSRRPPGRPGISEVRSKVLEEALELYAQHALRLVA